MFFSHKVMLSFHRTFESLSCLYVTLVYFNQLAVVTAQGSNINPSLSITPAIVSEGNSQTLTCIYSGSQSVSEIQWRVNTVTAGFFTESEGSCQAAFPPNATLYSYICDVSSKTFTLTIKNVRRTNRQDQWDCKVKVPNVSSNYLTSNVVKPEVKVLIASVSMTLPQTNTVTLQENTPHQFQCVTSGGLPEPTVKWYKDTSVTGNDDEITSSIKTSYSNTTDGLLVTTSSLTFTPTKDDNERSIYCSAFTADQTPKLSTRKPELNILYGPDGDLTIQGYTDGETYKVIENTQGHLTCLIRGGNPLPTLTWNCYSTGTPDTTDADTVSKTVRWTVGSGQDRSCTCYSTHFSENGSVTIHVQILYPPTKPIFYIQSTKVSGTVNVIKNNSVSVNCSSSGKPNQIQYTWTPSITSSSGSVLNINKVQSDDQYTCDVQNKMDPSDDPTDGDAVTGRNSSSVHIVVLYPPSTPTLRYWNTSGHVIKTNSLNVIQGDTFKVACTSDGKPDPDFYQWDTRGNNQLLTVSSIATDKTDHKYKCTVKNSMRETVPPGRNPTRGSATSTLTVHVLYPPSSPSLYYRYGQGSENELTYLFRKIEGNADTVTVICNSNSEPRPTFSWNGTLTSHSAMLTLANIDRSKAGIYICSVENEMTRTYGNPAKVVHGRNDGSFSLQILYPPLVGDLLNRSVAEGDSLTVSCPVKDGNPAKTTFKWTNSSGGEVSRTQTLTIDKVSRNGAKFYTCEVANEMHQTGKQQAISKPDQKSFHLNVWYGATVKQFYVDGFTGNTNVTVNENGTVNFKCSVDSNPGSNMTVQNKTKGKDIASDTNSKSLEYILDSATCFDAGFYMCTGSNQYNTKMSVKQLRLFVNCSPRPSPFIQLKENITSAKHEAAVFTFTALAYPEPTKKDFRWFRWNISQWVSLSNNVAYQIDTDGLQSNLTVKDVNRTSYGEYKMNVSNTFGEYKHIYRLLPQDKPDDPTDFEHVQEIVSETSFTVRWKPGFDNGLDQVFILKYRKMSDQEWNVVNIPDTGKSQMDYTVSGLSSGTNYQVVIYASNQLGNSSELKIASITTKAQDTPNIGPLIGGAVGGSVGLLLFLALGFLLIRKFRLGKGKDTSEVELNRRQMEDQDDESSEDEVITENAMYESAGGVVKKNLVHDNVYARPQKKAKTNQDVYAVVNKGKKPGQKKKQKDKAPKNDTGDIYENAPDVSANKDKTYANSAYEDSPYEDANTATTSKHVKKNADGLIYADLAFNDQPKGQKKLVIHGLDSMTEYVEVDFTKKADPLPDSDTEDQK